LICDKYGNMIEFNRKYKKEPALFSFIRLHIILSLISAALLLLIMGTYFFVEAADHLNYKVTQQYGQELNNDSFTPTAIIGSLMVPMDSFLGYFWYHPGLWNNFLFHPIHLITSFVMLLLLYLVFRNLDYSKPFVPSVARYIYGLAWLLIVDFLIMFLRKFQINQLITAYTDQEFRYDIYNGGMFDSSLAMGLRFGIILLVVAMIYRKGVEMAQDQELVI